MANTLVTSGICHGSPRFSALQDRQGCRPSHRIFRPRQSSQALLARCAFRAVVVSGETSLSELLSACEGSKAGDGANTPCAPWWVFLSCVTPELFCKYSSDEVDILNEKLFYRLIILSGWRKEERRARFGNRESRNKFRKGVNHQ